MQNWCRRSARATVRSQSPRSPHSPSSSPWFAYSIPWLLVTHKVSRVILNLSMRSFFVIMGIMIILVCNDDGIQSDGILTLEEALRPIGEIYTVAPDRPQSSMSHALTLHRPLRVQ